MRDLAGKWPATPDWATATIDEAGVNIRTLSGLSQCLVSGDLAAWSAASGIAGPAVGAGMIATGGEYEVRIARDRVLAVSERPFTVEPGWHDGGFAVSVMDGGLHVFEIGGPGVSQVLARAMTLDPQKTSASASVLFAGIDVFLYYHASSERARLHVDRGLAPYLWEWFEQSSWLWRSDFGTT